MKTQEKLTAAAKNGLISPDQVAALAAFLDSNGVADSSGARLRGEEELRFVRNLHDIFIALGIFLLGIGLVGAIAYVVEQVRAANLGIDSAFIAIGGGVFGAGVMWALAEAFARRRRLFFPAIATAIGFSGFAALTAAGAYLGAIGVDGDNIGASLAGRFVPLAVAGAALAAAFGFFARFRLPFSLGLIAGLSLASVLALVGAFVGEDLIHWLPAIALCAGVAALAAAVRFDMQDPARQSLAADNAFWLHAAAAPMLMHGALGLLFGDANGAITYSLGSAATALSLIVLMALISLALNRRALVVSGLITAGLSIATIIGAAEIASDLKAILTLITLGLIVISFGGGWHMLRRGLVGLIKPQGVWARIVPIEAVD